MQEIEIHIKMKKYIQASFLLLALALFSSASAFSYPSQVTNVRAIPIGETSVQVSWNEATSAEDIIIGYRVYYGRTSVQDLDATYDNDVFASGSKSIIVGDLTPSTDYYFAVTALDSEENESEKYSVEIMATTKGDIIDQTPEPEDIPEPEVEAPEENTEEPEIIEEPEVLPEEPPVVEEPEVFGPEVPEGLRPSAPDIVAPLEAMNLSADMSQISSNSTVLLSWAKSINIDNDVTDQILYVRKNLGPWDSGYSIGKDLETIELDVERGAMYEFKVETTDGAGNISESRVYSFSTELSKSGPANVMGIAVAIFILFGLGMMAVRRRS